MNYKIKVDAERRIGEIHGNIYGHFIEHLGRCIYGGIYGEKGHSLPIPNMYSKIVEITKSYCSYVYETYGRIPKYHDAMFIPILAQIHHLDTGFYEKFFPEYLDEVDKAHMSTWHSERTK